MERVIATRLVGSRGHTGGRRFPTVIDPGNNKNYPLVSEDHHTVTKNKQFVCLGLHAGSSVLVVCGHAKINYCCAHTHTREHSLSRQGIWAPFGHPMTQTLKNHIHLRALSESFPMNTSMTGLQWFSKIFCIPVLATKEASDFCHATEDIHYNTGEVYLI